MPENVTKLILYCILFTTISFLVLSIPTAVIPNRFFIRMTPVFWFDYIFLVINSILIGIYFGITYSSPKPEVCVVEKKSIFAQVLSFLGIACPICNKILVFIFGTIFLLTYLEPLRPYLSLLSALLLLWLVIKKAKLSLFLKTVNIVK